jgi:starch phosphorylase
MSQASGTAERAESGRAGLHAFGHDVDSLRRSITQHLLYSVGKDPVSASARDWLNAVSVTVRDRLVDRWMDTTRRHYRQNVKRVYYLSLEFLPGRTLANALIALGLYETCHGALREVGQDLDVIAELESDPALGNGGLGRLAACFMDSLATLDLPGFGYGIRYEYGMFAQCIRQARQVEVPDHWLVGGNPWEFPRPEITCTIQFGGRVEQGARGVRWVDTDDVLAMAYDTLVPGYGTQSVNTLRLWSAIAATGINLSLFNQGDYTAAVEAKNRSENVTRVLYPDDSTERGHELRLRQEFFFVSASLQDMLRRYLRTHTGMEQLPDKVAIHLNDTHPAIAIPELMRLLVDEHGLAWELAWRLSTRVFSYTNHTLMPEALETWPVAMLGRVLPRHLQIIYEINERFLGTLRAASDADDDLLRRVSLVDEGNGQRVRMANLCVIASHKVNGVSRLHAELLRTSLFADFDRLYPGRIVNITNGITPRRWLAVANPGLARLVDRTIGSAWRTRLEAIGSLRAHAEDPDFGVAFRSVRMAAKRHLADHIMRETGVAVSPESLFDVHVKRIHEYKRQLLNVLQVITRYNRMLADPGRDWVPRTVIFAGKAASAYTMAKLVIELINRVAEVINGDSRLDARLRVVFIPNYSVSVASLVIPAADLSEQISTPGTEASGTGNMKLALNGALTIATEDGATIELRDTVGSDDIFMFGHSAAELVTLRSAGYDPRHYYAANAELRMVIDQIAGGHFCAQDPARFAPIVRSLIDEGDHYMLLADYADYLAAQARVDDLFRLPAAWTARAVRNIAAMGPFSSDRAIGQYANDIWRIQPVGI